MGFSFQAVDIHAHLLPGLDDGPRTMDESLRLCELYLPQGVTTVVATPHMCDPRFDVSPEAVRNSVRELSEACRQRGLSLDILPGGDIRLQPELLEVLDAGELLTINDTGKYLLLELPPQVVPRIGGLIFELAVRGVTPILSHPERNLEFCRKPECLVDLVERGCLVQVTAGSLLGQFGPVAKRAAERFLESGMVHVVAGDAHSSRGRRPELRRAAELLMSLVGEDVTSKLLYANPAKIVRGEPSQSIELGLGRAKQNRFRVRRRAS